MKWPSNAHLNASNDHQTIVKNIHQHGLVWTLENRHNFPMDDHDFFFFSEMGRTWGIQTCIKLSIVVHSIQASHPNHGGHSGHRATGWTAGPRQAGLERLNEWLELANERRCLDNKHIFSGPSLKAMERERERYIYIYTIHIIAIFIVIITTGICFRFLALKREMCHRVSKISHVIHVHAFGEETWKKLWEAEIPLFHWVGLREKPQETMDICSKSARWKSRLSLQPFSCIWILLRPFHEWDQLNHIYICIYIYYLQYICFAFRCVSGESMSDNSPASSRGLQGLQGERQAAAAEDLEVRPPGAAGERRLTGRWPWSGSVGRCARLLGARWDHGWGHGAMVGAGRGQETWKVTSVQGCTDIMERVFNRINQTVFPMAMALWFFQGHGPWASTPSQTRVCLISILKHLRIHRFIISFPIQVAIHWE